MGSQRPRATLRREVHAAQQVLEARVGAQGVEGREPVGNKFLYGGVTRTHQEGDGSLPSIELGWRQHHFFAIKTQAQFSRAA